MDNTSDTSYMLRLVYENLIETESSLVYLFGRHSSSDGVTYGIVTKYGIVLEDAVFNKNDIRVYNKNRHNILEIYFKDTGYIHIFELIDTGMSVKTKQVYRSKQYKISRLISSGIVLYNTDSYNGHTVIDYSGHRGSKEEYLSVIEHKNSRDLICPRFLEIDPKTKLTICKFDILTTKGKPKMVNIRWSEELTSKYLITESLAHRRNIHTVSYTTDSKGKVVLKVNGIREYYS